MNYHLDLMKVMKDVHRKKLIRKPLKLVSLLGVLQKDGTGNPEKKKVHRV